MELVISLGIVVTATVLILNLGGVAGRSPFSVSDLQGKQKEVFARPSRV
jgi:hypothetical protein